MNPYLIVQSIGSSPEDRFKPYMELQQPIHEEYAKRCGADYECFVGYKEPDLNPTWNRIPMILDGFDAGYERVFWMDADTLAVDLNRNVFTETPEAPLVMTRVEGAYPDMPWKYAPELRKQGFCAALHSPPNGRVCGLPHDHARTDDYPSHDHMDGQGCWPQWDVWNDGVLLATNGAHARAALEFAWSKRHAPFQPWHVPGMPELDWLLDFCFDQPDVIAELPEQWNWHFKERCPREQAVIMAWHGEIAQNRWNGFVNAYREFYG